MSGKQSRAKRVEAVKKAEQDVYKYKAIPYEDIDNPFDGVCDRQARIYEKYYRQLSDKYWQTCFDFFLYGG